MMTYDAVLLAVRHIVADTFQVGLASVRETTVAEDVDGWDSLNHTILMVRLARRFGPVVDESLSSQARTVGDLASGICAGAEAVSR